MLLIGSPMRTAFSTCQMLNATRAKSSGARCQAYKDACMHMEFADQLYLDQIAENRYFLHEHMMHASSWNSACMRRLIQLPGVDNSLRSVPVWGRSASWAPQRLAGYEARLLHVECARTFESIIKEMHELSSNSV